MASSMWGSGGRSWTTAGCAQAQGCAAGRIDLLAARARRGAERSAARRGATCHATNPEPSEPRRPPPRANRALPGVGQRGRCAIASISHTRDTATRRGRCTRRTQRCACAALRRRALPRPQRWLARLPIPGGVAEGVGGKLEMMQRVRQLPVRGPCLFGHTSGIRRKLRNHNAFAYVVTQFSRRILEAYCQRAFDAGYVAASAVSAAVRRSRSTPSARGLGSFAP